MRRLKAAVLQAVRLLFWLTAGGTVGSSLTTAIIGGTIALPATYFFICFVSYLVLRGLL